MSTALPPGIGGGALAPHPHRARSRTIRAHAGPRGQLELSVDEFDWAGRAPASLPSGVVLRIKWWGEAGLGSELRRAAARGGSPRSADALAAARRPAMHGEFGSDSEASKCYPVSSSPQQLMKYFAGAATRST